MNDYRRKKLVKNIESMEKRLLKDYRENRAGCIAQFLEEKQRVTSLGTVVATVFAALCSIVLAIYAVIELPTVDEQVEGYLLRVLIITTVWIFALIHLWIAYQHNLYRKALVEYKENLLRKHGWWN